MPMPLQLIKGLEEARGNGTSMISLIMPPKDQVSHLSLDLPSPCRFHPGRCVSLCNMGNMQTLKGVNVRER